MNGLWLGLALLADWPAAAANFNVAHVAELAKYDQELSCLGPEDYGRAMRTAYAAEKRNTERLGLGNGP